MKCSFVSDRTTTARPVRLVVLVLCFASLPVLARAQDQSATAKLVSAQASGSTKFTSAQVLVATGLQLGSQVGRDDFQRGADNLAKTGRFASVQYRYADAEGGVRVEYQVTDAPSVRVDFDNFPWFTDDELTAAVKASVPLFDGTAPETGSVLDDISDALQLQIAKAGVHSTVSHALTTAPGTDDRVQQFRVDEETLDLASLEFRDSLAQNDRSIHSQLSDIVGAKYSRSALVLFEFEQVRPLYISRGFMRATFGAPNVHVVTSAGHSAVAAVVPIDPGPVFTWRVPTWTGSTVFSQLELAAMIPLHDGDVADGMKIERGWQAVEDAYAARGYLDVDLARTPHFDEGAKSISYAVSITEGPQYRMGKLVLTGLSNEGESRIRSAWKIPVGAVFNRSVYDDFLANGIKDAFSGLPFHYEKIGHFLQKDAANATVDVLIDFQ